MELKEAIEKLKNKVNEWNKYKNENVISNMELVQEIDDENIAIDTVLEELNNRIPRKDIEELLEQLYRGKPLLDENGNEIGKRYEYIAIHYLENLLNKEI